MEKGKKKQRGAVGSSFRVGARVAIRTSWHSDIVPGQVGKVVERVRGYYAIEITGFFGDALRPHIRSHVPETRVVFFRRCELKLLGF